MNVTAIVTCMTEAELPFVREAIYSVQTQTCACELLVIVPEDNSTILSYFRGFENAFTLYPVPMYPAGIVRNLGVARATTEWVAFLDGDDVWTPTKTERQLVAARRDRQPLYWNASSVNPRRWNTFLLRIRQTYADAQQLAGKTGSSG